MHMKDRLCFMKYILIMVIFTFSSESFGKEDCSEESLGLVDSSHIAEKLFYREEYQIDSLNNLGFLKFYGYGITVDKNGAVEYWKKAILLGHYESEYHLCHAYADKDEPTFNYALGKKHCEKAFLIYRGMEDPDEEIMNQIKTYRTKLNGH